MKYYGTYGILLTYLSTQIHEGLHWLVACAIGVNSSVGVLGLQVSESIPAWQFIWIASAGPASLIAFLTIGFVLLKSTSLLGKQIGFLFTFLITIGQLLYELTSFWAGSTDETGIAIRLGISDFALRVPLILLSLIVLAYLLKRYKDLWNFQKLVLSFGVLVITMLVSLSMNSFMEHQQRLGQRFFQPTWHGYTPALAIINAVSFIILMTLIIRSLRTVTT